MEITLFDYIVFFLFVGGVALFGCSFYFRSSRGAAAFTAAAEKRLCIFLRFICLIFAVDKLCKLKSQNFLCLVKLAALPGLHCVYLFKGQESEHSYAL